MNFGSLLAVSLFLFQAAPPTLPTDTGPLRNTFVVGAQTVIDNALAIDLKAAEPAFTAELQTLKATQANLSTMADTPREKDIADAASNMIFLISACHIQAKTGDTTQCESQLARARGRIMESINKHKTGGAWQDGPPAS